MDKMPIKWQVGLKPLCLLDGDPSPRSITLSFASLSLSIQLGDPSREAVSDENGGDALFLLGISRHS